MSGRTTAREARERRRADSSRQLSLDFAQNDVSQAQAAQAIGCGPQIVQRYCDPEHAACLPLADVPALPESVAIAQLRWAAEQIGHELQRVRTGETIQDDLAYLADLAVASSALVADFARAIDDGVITAEEAEQGLRLCDQLSEMIDALKVRLRVAARARVDGVRRGNGGAN